MSDFLFFLFKFLFKKFHKRPSNFRSKFRKKFVDQFFLSSIFLSMRLENFFFIFDYRLLLFFSFFYSFHNDFPIFIDILSFHLFVYSFLLIPIPLFFFILLKLQFFIFFFLFFHVFINRWKQFYFVFFKFSFRPNITRNFRK